MIPMIDTICCVLLGLIMAFFAYGHLTKPEESFEQLFGFPVHDPIQVHFVAIMGGFFACIAITLITLGLFQPSSNARKFALIAYAIMQGINIKTMFRYPVHKSGGDENGDENEPPPTTSIMDMPIPLMLFFMGIALVGAFGSRTDAQRAQIVRNRKKAELYAKHAHKKVMSKKD